MNTYKEEITKVIEEHCEYFNLHSTRLVDSVGIPKIYSNIKSLLVYDRKDKLHLLGSEGGELSHCLFFFQTPEHTSVEHTMEVKEVGQKRELVCDAFGRNAPSCLCSSNTSQNGWVVPMVSGSFGKEVTEFHITTGLTGGVWG